MILYGTDGRIARDGVDLMNESASDQPAITVKPIAEAQIGEYVELADLLRVGGKFYQMDGTSYCDAPLSSFVLDLPGGYRRIE
jgi:hypothetical protein